MSFVFQFPLTFLQNLSVSLLFICHMPGPRLTAFWSYEFLMDVCYASGNLLTLATIRATLISLSTDVAVFVPSINQLLDTCALHFGQQYSEDSQHSQHSHAEHSPYLQYSLLLPFSDLIWFFSNKYFTFAMAPNANGVLNIRYIWYIRKPTRMPQHAYI